VTAAWCWLVLPVDALRLQVGIVDERSASQEIDLDEFDQRLNGAFLIA
jgi:hypothetical protein